MHKEPTLCHAVLLCYTYFAMNEELFLQELKEIRGMLGVSDKKVDHVIERVDGLTEKMEVVIERLDKNDKRWDENDKRWDEINDMITVTNERIDGLEQKMATKDDLSQLRAEMLHGQDEQITILRRLDQERHFTLERVRRLETDVERIKLQLQIA